MAVTTRERTDEEETMGEQQSGSGHVHREPYGVLADGAQVDRYTLSNDQGMVARVITLGAILTELHTPDRDGRPGDVVLGFDTLEPYIANKPHFGATIGRFANRIAGGQFDLDGETYHLPVNNGPNTLHGGPNGFDKRVWTAEPVDSPEGPGVRFSLVSPDGDEGFPGRLTASVTYTLTHDGALRLAYEATTDHATPVNLTNHSYFNLACGGTVLAHELTLRAAEYTPVGPGLIPTGEVAPVAGTPLDFRSPAAVGARIDRLKPDPGGYDHNYVLDAHGDLSVVSGRAHDRATGRTLEFWTTQPAVQFYSGNFLDGSLLGKGGRAYHQHAGFCLETQHYPDSVHHPAFPTTIVRPGEVYQQTTIYRFSVG